MPEALTPSGIHRVRTVAEAGSSSSTSDLASSRSSAPAPSSTPLNEDPFPNWGLKGGAFRPDSSHIDQPTKRQTRGDPGTQSHGPPRG